MRVFKATKIKQTRLLEWQSFADWFRIFADQFIAFDLYAFLLLDFNVWSFASSREQILWSSDQLSLLPSARDGLRAMGPNSPLP